MGGRELKNEPNEEKYYVVSPANKGKLTSDSHPLYLKIMTSPLPPSYGEDRFFVLVNLDPPLLS